MATRTLFQPLSPIPPLLKRLCSLNFFIAIVGYSIAMGLLSPFGIDADLSGGGNRLFTWPYRIFALIVHVVTLFAVRSRPMPKLDWRFGMMFFFWSIYLLRAIYDLEIRSDFVSEATLRPYYGLQAWNSIIFGCLIPMLAILKSIDIIDFEKVSKWIFYVGGIALCTSLTSIQKMAEASWTGENTGRAGASAMLNTISFGHLGLSVAAIAFYRIKNKKNPLWERLTGIGVMLLGGYVILRAGSRGPILCAFAMAFFYALSRSRYVAIGALLAGIFSGVVALFFQEILNLIRSISPVLAERIASSVYEGDSSGRDALIASYWKEICDNPLTGGHLDLLGYSHNACFDGLLMFGFLFGWIILVLVLIGYGASYRLLKQKNENWWAALLTIQFLTACQTSGTFGGNGIVQCLWTVCALWTIRNRQKPFSPYLQRKQNNIIHS